MLIDKTEIALHRQISTSVRDDRINPFIEDAELLDLKGLLGEPLYNAIVKTPTNAEYVKLLAPHTYTYNSIEYRHQGLKKVLSIFSYARYILQGSNVDTGFGFVNKSTQDSQAVPTEGLRMTYKKDQQTAHLYFNEVRLYLDRNAETYPLWKIDCSTPGAQRIRIGKITI